MLEWIKEALGINSPQTVSLQNIYSKEKEEKEEKIYKIEKGFYLVNNFCELFIYEVKETQKKKENEQFFYINYGTKLANFRTAKYHDPKDRIEESLILAVKKGAKFQSSERDPFKRIEVEVCEVKEGYVLYSFSGSDFHIKESLSIAEFLVKFKQKED
jgi:hypothetical protein